MGEYLCTDLLLQLPHRQFVFTIAGSFQRGWYGRAESVAPAQAEAVETVAVTKRASRKAWARLLAKVYGIDVLCCPKCGGRMSVIAIIRDPESIRKIVACMGKQGRGPPEPGCRRIAKARDGRERPALAPNSRN